MKWIIVTCDNSKHIVPAQKWLFEKYAPSADLHYLDVGSEGVNTWGQNVLKRLPDDEYIVFGLDDYLPIDKLNKWIFTLALGVLMGEDYDRFELGWGASKKEGFNEKIFVGGLGSREFLEYGPETPYSVSCQFSIWKTSALKEILSKCTTPWNFEVKHKCKAACFSTYPVFRWIEESAISSRHPGKINVLGLRPADLKELISLGLIDENKIQYGMPKGPVPPFDKNKLDEKYRQFYE